MMRACGRANSPSAVTWYVQPSSSECSGGDREGQSRLGVVDGDGAGRDRVVFLDGLGEGEAERSVVELLGDQFGLVCGVGRGIDVGEGAEAVADGFDAVGGAFDL